MTRPDFKESEELTALTELVRATVKRPSSAELEQGLNTLHARLARLRVPRRARWSLVVAALLSCLGLAVGIGFLSRSSSSVDRAVAVNRIEGGQILDGGYLAERGSAGIRLFFEEGSQFALTSGTRGRLRSAKGDGTRLALEHGEASFQITESRDHRWFVEAGPFVVSVRGTDFDVVWNPKQEQIDVRLRRGRVAVSGPVVGSELVLRPGQNLSVSLPKAEVLITEGKRELRSEDALTAPSASAAPTPLAAAVESDAPKPPAAGAHVAPRPSSAGPRQWKAALANGQWDRILADVERDGVESTVQTLTSDELLALADAARYRRRTSLARVALLEQIRRFPGSSRSLDAIFLLGRVEEAAGAKAAAVKRYDEYLARADARTFAAEALGRRMVLTTAVEGAASAQRVAQDYLRRFPQGSYAEAARALRLAQ